MYKFIGEFSILEDLGFICNQSHDYYFLPRKFMYKDYTPISVDIKTRIVEYSDEHDLQLIEKFVEEIV